MYGLENFETPAENNRPKHGLGLGLLDLMVAAALVGGPPRRRNYEPTNQDRIQPGIDQSPFVDFWATFNAQREQEGLPEALYREAREAFDGGPTPDGALTFVGKEGAGVRAVRRHNTYRGEFREVSDAGNTVWRVVHTTNGAVCYHTAEEALRGAIVAKRHSEAHKS